VWRNQILNGDNFTTFGDLFSYTMFYCHVFPLRQIADKFNEMQLGMIALRAFFCDY
jgi:hypothetical protein